MKTSTPSGSRFIWLGASLFGASLFAVAGGGYLWGRASAARLPPRERANAAADGVEDARRVGNAPAGHVHGSGERPHEHPHAHEHPHEEAIPAAVRGQAQAFEAQAVPTMSPEEARAREIERLKATGPDRRNLIVDARRVGADWAKMAAEKKLEVSFDDWQCYRGGCVVNARHAASGSLENATNEITHTRGFLDWNGEKLRTGPVDTGAGKAEVTWILFAPAEGEHAFRDSND